MTKGKVTKLVLSLVLVISMVLGTVQTSFAMNATRESSPETEDVSEITEDEKENEETVESEEDETDDVLADNQEEKPIEVSKEDAEVTEAEDEETEEIDDDPEFAEITLTYEGPDYSIDVICGADAEIDTDTELTVKEYDPESKTYQERYEEAEAFYNWEDGEEPEARLFDVSLWHDEEEVEPDAPVQVTFTFPVNGDDDKAKEGTDEDVSYEIIHFGAEETDIYSPEAVFDDGKNSLTFELDSFSDIMVLAGDSQYEYVILNLGNMDGTYRDGYGYWTWVPIAGYWGADTGFGNDWRITAAIPSSNLDSDGNLVINLPSDNNLPATTSGRTSFNIYNGVSVSLPKEQAYDYTLVGWINIGTGQYYSVKDGQTTATINTEDDNIFYADWEAATYDVGQYDGNVEDTVSTDFVTVKMFDYNELFNLYSVDNTASGNYSTEPSSDSKKEYWKIGNNFYTAPVGNDSRSILIGNDGEVGSFAFYDGKGSRSGNDGFLGYPNNRADQNDGSVGSTGSVNISKHLNVTDRNDIFFKDYLFDETGNTLGVNYVGTADYLFKYGTNEDATAVDNGYVGYYYYDSRYNAANYNQSEKRFYVYNGPSDVEGASYKEGFFPYNTYSDTLSYNDGSVNYFFGMSMEVQIYLPDEVGTNGANMVSSDEPMVFNFSGDDDIWIFVDDTLVADMSGVHNKSYASVDFNSGEVTIKTTDTSGNVVDTIKSSEGVNGVKGIEGMSAGRHTLTVYYLERGGNSSNLIVSFNVAPSWDYETDSLQTVDVEKTWYDADGNLIENTSELNLPAITVGLYEGLTEEDYTVYSNSSGTTYSFVYADPYTGSETTYIYETDSSGGFVSLKIGEQEFTEIDDGWVVDSKGDPLAKLDSDGTLWIIMDTCVLNEDNEWKYSWDLLDLDRDYCTKEFASDGTYKLISSSESTDHQATGAYWTPIGEDGIEESVGTGRMGPVILTDAAQHNEAIGSLDEAEGFVIVCGEGGTLNLESVMFSEHATFELTTDDEGTPYYHSRLGVCSEADIAALGEGALWYFEESGKYVTDISGSKVEAFYIYCTVGGTRYYLTISDGEVITSTTPNELFFYDSLGELIAYAATIDDPDLQDELAITIGNDNGELILRASSTTVPGDNDVRVYTLDESFEITKTSASYTNQLITYNMQIFKYEEGNLNSPLEGAEFVLSMTGDDGETYYAVAEPVVDDGNTVYKVTSWTASKDEATALTSGNDGYIRIQNLNLGTYTLTETKAPAGYSLLSDSISFTLTIDTDGNVIITVDGDNEGIDAEKDTLRVANTSVVTLPNTGGEGVWLFLVLGLALVGVSLIVVRRRRRSLSA